jgi:hypothetical protein
MCIRPAAEKYVVDIIDSCGSEDVDVGILSRNALGMSVAGIFLRIKDGLEYIFILAMGM